MKNKNKQLDIDDILNSEETLDMESGEIKTVEKSKLNQVIYKETRRKDGSLRIQQDFSNCPTLAEQHTAHLTDINYLIEKYKPDELAAYIAARSQYRQEILGHDFSKDHDLQSAKNIVYRSKQEFEALPDDIKYSFKNHVEFLKFIDNPANAEKMIKLGILKKKQIENLQSLEPVKAEPTTPTPTKHEEKEKAKAT